MAVFAFSTALSIRSSVKMSADVSELSFACEPARMMRVDVGARTVLKPYHFDEFSEIVEPSKSRVGAV